MLVSHQFRAAALDVEAFAEFLLYDAVHVAFVYDGTVVVHQAEVEEHLRAVAVYVAHIEVVRHGIAGAVGDALRHPLGGTVGEGQAQHILVLHSLLVGMHYALSQYVRLPAPRRRQHQMPSAPDLNGFLLPRVKLSLH